MDAVRAGHPGVRQRPAGRGVAHRATPHDRRIAGERRPPRADDPHRTLGAHTTRRRRRRARRPARVDRRRPVGRRAPGPVRHRPHRTRGLADGDDVGEHAGHDRCRCEQRTPALPSRSRLRRERRHRPRAPGAGHRDRLPVLPRSQAARRNGGPGELHPARLALAEGDRAVGQQRARLLRRQRRQQAEPERAGAPPVGTFVELPAEAVPPQARVVLRPPVPVHVEPEQALLVAGQPQAEHHPGVLLRQHLARPPAGQAHRVHRGRGQLPGREPLRARQAGRPGRHPDRGRREHPPRAAGRRPHRQREHEHTTGRAVAADADVPAAPARHVLPERRPVRADRRGRRGRHRLPRVHPRIVEPAGRRRDGELDPGRRRGGRHGRGVERLVRDGLPGLARSAARQ